MDAQEHDDVWRSSAYTHVGGWTDSDTLHEDDNELGGYALSIVPFIRFLGYEVHEQHWCTYAIRLQMSSLNFYLYLL